MLPSGAADVFFVGDRGVIADAFAVIGAAVAVVGVGAVVTMVVAEDMPMTVVVGVGLLVVLGFMYLIFVVKTAVSVELMVFQMGLYPC